MPSDSHLDENGFVVLDVDTAGIAAHSHRAQIADCALCDADGYRGGTVCDHRDHAAETVNGRAEAARVLADIAARRASRARGPIDGGEPIERLTARRTDAPNDPPASTESDLHVPDNHLCTPTTLEGR